MNGEFSTLFVTASSTEEAKKISYELLKTKLVACVNIIPQVTSLYIWEGKQEESNEVLMMIKVRMHDFYS